MLLEINLLELNTDLFRINAKILRITSKKFAPSFPFNVVPVWRVWLLIERVQIKVSALVRVTVQGVKSLGGHFACLCRGI